jgi:hypothetical protein
MVSNGEHERELLVSDLIDPLSSLASAAVALARGAEYSTAEWVEEPGTYRWLFQRDGDRLTIRILYFRGMFSQLPDHKGELAFTAECRLVAIVPSADGSVKRGIY